MLKIALLLLALGKPAVIKTANVSAYCSCESCCGKADGITADGWQLQEGDLVVAAPKGIAFGTVIDIPGYGKATVRDRGGAINGNKLDVWFPTHAEALKWGRQILEVTYEKL